MPDSGRQKASGSAAPHLLGQIEQCNASLKALARRGWTGDARAREALGLHRRLLRLSAELSVAHLESIASWRDSVQVSAKLLTMEAVSARQGQDFETDQTPGADSCPRRMVDTVLDVLLDLQRVEATLRKIRCKLDPPELPDGSSPAEVAPQVSPSLQQSPPTPEAPVEGRNPPFSHKALGNLAVHSGSTSTNDKDVEGQSPSGAAGQGLEATEVQMGMQTAGQTTAEGCLRTGLEAMKKEETETEAKTTGKDPLKAKGRRMSWVTVALGHASCYVTAPVAMAQGLFCEEADDLSALLVSEREELVSRVLRIRHVGGATKTTSPLSVVLPFRVRYRCGHRDIMVKVIDEDRRASYVHPIATEGAYGGERVQPMEGALLSALRSHCDAAQAVLSSSPLLYLSHPSPQPLCRPLTLTLPCPPGPDKRRPEEEAGSGQLASATPIGAMTLYNARVPSASVKLPASLSTEPLVLLGWREGQWMVLDDVAVRNAQNGLASFELVEHVERLIVFRLIPSARPSLLTSLMGDVEESSATTAVSLVLLQKQGEPQQAVVVAVLTRDLDGDLGRLCAEGYSNPSDPPPTVALREGEQLQLSFSGNITSTGHNSSATRRITFHKQRENRAFLTLCEVDEFGNYSSPHYRGTVIFHRVPKGRPTGCGNAHCDMVDRAALPPVCKLPVTLPKKARTVVSPCSATVMSCCQENELLSDDILLWLAEELVEEDAASLLPRLGLRRGAVQRARQLSPDRLPDRLLHLLVLWRRSLPAIADKVHMLARHLSKCGRTDLSRELLLRRGGNREAQEKQATARGTL